MMGFWRDLVRGAKNQAESTRIITVDQLAASIFGGMQSSAGMAVTSESALKVATVTACVRVLSENIGVLPFSVYEREGENQHIERSHPAHRLIDEEPNEFQTAQEFREWAMVQLALRGNAFAWINRVRGEVREVLPLATDSVEVVLSESYRLSYRIKESAGTVREVPANQVLHVRGLSLDGVTGVSALTYMRESIGTAMAAQEQGARVYGNGSTPRGQITRDAPFKDDEAAKEFRRKLDEEYTGVRNSSRVAIMPPGMKWEAMGMTPVDAQYVQSREFERSDIAAHFRVPPHMVNDLSRATFSNIEHQSLEFVQQTLMPWLTKFENGFARRLLSREERARFFIAADVKELLRGDAEARAKFYATGIQWGWLSPNDARRAENLNARDGGDTYLQPVNMAPSPYAPNQSTGGGDDAA